MTARKMKTVMPSLKAPVDKALRSGLQNYVLRVQLCYVWQTTRHLLVINYVKKNKLLILLTLIFLLS